MLAHLGHYHPLELACGGDLMDHVTTPLTLAAAGLGAIAATLLAATVV